MTLLADDYPQLLTVDPTSAERVAEPCQFIPMSQLNIPAASRAPTIGWAERRMADLAGARAFLRARGRGVTRASEQQQTWFITGIFSSFTDEGVIEYAVSQGFAGASA